MLFTVHIVCIVTFILVILGSFLFKVYADWFSDHGAKRQANHLLYLIDLWLITPLVAAVYFSGRSLAESRGLDIGSVPFIKQSLFLFGLSGTIWLTVLLPIQIIHHRQTSPVHTELPASYQKLAALWLITATLVKIAPLIIVYMMRSKTAVL